MAALFFDDFNGPAGNLAGRVVGGATWQDSGSGSPQLDGSGNVVFPEGWNFARIDVVPDAPVFDTIIHCSSGLMPFETLYFGIADSPTIGQSYTGAQIVIDPAAGTATILGTYGGESFNFTPAGSMKFAMRLTLGSTLVELLYQDAPLGAYNIESPISLASPTKLFINGSPSNTLADIGIFTPEEPEVGAFWTDFVSAYEIP